MSVTENWFYVPCLYKTTVLQKFTVYVLVMLQFSLLFKDIILSHDSGISTLLSGFTTQQITSETLSSLFVSWDYNATL